MTVQRTQPGISGSRESAASRLWIVGALSFTRGSGGRLAIEAFHRLGDGVEVVVHVERERPPFHLAAP